MSDTYTPFAAIRYDQAAVARQGYGAANSGATDDQMIVGFYRRSILNRSKSQEKGIPVYEARDFVKIQHPGESYNVVDKEATEVEKRRWPQRWQQYVEGISQTPDGIPINLLFPHRPEVEATLKGYNIHTVEQLANLSGTAIQTVGMGCQEWVNGAAKYLEHARKGVDHHQHAAELSKRDAVIATMKRQVDDLTNIVNQLKHAQQQTVVPHNFDYQTAQINTTHASSDESTAHLQPPAQFVQDLSGFVEAKNERMKGVRGRPLGSKTKSKEN